LVEPDELRAALEANLDARRYWDAFPPSTRRAILEWIGSAKRPATHQKRIVEMVEQALNVRANQWLRAQCPSRALKDGPGIEDAERVQGVLDGQ
jgi:hypothetical protein